MRFRITEEMVVAATLGGAVYGGGGGAEIDGGLVLGRLAVRIGQPELITIDELPDDAILVTASLVGSQASGQALLPVHLLKALEILSDAIGKPVSGITTNECGGSATVNGWFQAAVAGVPVVDAPCNGRAHPTGVMGSIGLHKRRDYVSVQAAVGGDHASGTYLEMVVRGSLERASTMVRQASVECGGLVAVARNPVEVRYVKKHAAIGAISRCIELGRAMIEARDSGRSPADAVTAFTGGRVIAKGEVTQVEIRTGGGFDVGSVIVRDAASDEDVELTFWNEYICAERGSRRLFTFPDLISVLRTADGTPLTTAHTEKGESVTVIGVPRQSLILGAGMRDPELMRPIEIATGKEVVRYMLGS